MRRPYYMLMLLIFPFCLFAGNPDRQGEAGAYELLLSPWAKAAGLNLMTVANVSGVEAMRINPAGIRFSGRMIFTVGYLQLYTGADIGMSAAGFAFKIGSNGTVGINLSSMNFGKIENTTVLQPEGTGGVFSPNYTHVAIAYSHTFNDKISVGVLLRGISEQVIDVQALGVAVDAGIQYKGGVDDRFRLGISLRNIGPSMRYRGEGLAKDFDDTEPQTVDYLLVGYVRSAKFELPTLLNLGVSYAIPIGNKAKLTTVLNFTSNAFSRDNIGVGVELDFKKSFQMRGGYKFSDPFSKVGGHELHNGVSAGFSFKFKTAKQPHANQFAIDYAYRTTRHYQGSHNIGLRYIIK